MNIAERPGRLPPTAWQTSQELALRQQGGPGHLVLPTVFSGEPKPEPGEPIGNPLAACPTPTFGAPTLPSPGCEGAVFVPLIAAFFSSLTILAVLDWLWVRAVSLVPPVALLAVPALPLVSPLEAEG